MKKDSTTKFPKLSKKDLSELEVVYLYHNGMVVLCFERRGKDGIRTEFADIYKTDLRWSWRKKAKLFSEEKSYQNREEGRIVVHRSAVDNLREVLQKLTQVRVFESNNSPNLEKRGLNQQSVTLVFGSPHFKVDFDWIEGITDAGITIQPDNQDKFENARYHWGSLQVRNYKDLIPTEAKVESTDQVSVQ